MEYNLVMALNKNIYREESLNKITTPKQLASYIHQAKINWWIFSITLFIVAAATIIWALFSQIPLVLISKGLVVNKNTIVCYIPIEKIPTSLKSRFNDEIAINGIKGEGFIEIQSKIPLSYNELSATIDNDWTERNLLQSDFSYPLIINTDIPLNEIGTIVDISIRIGQEPPINFFIN